jgi:hypothetical protein
VVLIKINVKKFANVNIVYSLLETLNKKKETEVAAHKAFVLSPTPLFKATYPVIPFHISLFVPLTE